MKKTLAITLLLVLLATSVVALASQFDAVNGNTIANGNFGYLGHLYGKHGTEAAAKAKLAEQYKLNNLLSGPGGFGPAGVKKVAGECVCFDDCNGEACRCYWCIANKNEGCTCGAEAPLP